ncbi:MAG: hypothetical protein IPQ07_12925 [Myxococcales bacterium]|nr:hypothetical protein [Myxococcales bacterium]
MKVSIPLVTFAAWWADGSHARFNWAIVLGVFMVVFWLADDWARHPRHVRCSTSASAYVIAETLIFVPLLAIVQWKT